MRQAEFKRWIKPLLDRKLSEDQVEKVFAEAEATLNSYWDNDSPKGENVPGVRHR